jgi:hypothetical protein
VKPNNARTIGYRGIAARQEKLRPNYSRDRSNCDQVVAAVSVGDVRRLA